MDRPAKTVTALRTNSQLDASGVGAPLFDTSGKVIGWVGPIPYLFFNDETGDHSSSVADSAHAVSQLHESSTGVGKINGGRKTWLESAGTTVDGPPRTPRPSACRSHTACSSRSWTRRTRRAGRDPRRESRQDDRCPCSARCSISPAATSSSPSTARPCARRSDYNKILAGHKPGETVRVKLYRGHRLLTVKARVAAYPYTPATG